MEIKTLISLDKHIGRGIATGINWIMRLLGSLVKKDHTLNENVSAILVAKYKGMGSILHTIPLLRTLKENYPDARIIFATTERNRELLNILKVADEVICINDKGFKIFVSIPCFIFKLVRLKVDLFIDLELYSSFSSIITALSFSKNRIGFYQRSENYRFGIYSHMMYYNINAPVSKTYLQIAQLVGCKTEIIASQINLSEGNNLSSVNFKKPYILINPNASDLRLERRWPQQNFVHLILELNKYKPDYKIYLIGSSIEKEYVSSIVNQVPSGIPVKSFAGETNIRELIELIQNAEVFISNDTGPMHLAALLGKTTVALFGPCSPAHYGEHPSLRIIYKRLYCSPCVHEFSTPPCKGNNVCMQLITVEEVLKLCLEILEGQEQNLNQEDLNNKFIYSANNYLAGYIKR